MDRDHSDVWSAIADHYADPRDDRAVVYSRAYEYDQGGNRTAKIGPVNDREVVYHYDIENPLTYGSDNNRLMYYETLDTTPF